MGGRGSNNANGHRKSNSKAFLILLKASLIPTFPIQEPGKTFQSCGEIIPTNAEPQQSI
jgi:hypothetical protein